MPGDHLPYMLQVDMTTDGTDGTIRPFTDPGFAPAAMTWILQHQNDPIQAALLDDGGLTITDTQHGVLGVIYRNREGELDFAGNATEAAREFFKSLVAPMMEEWLEEWKRKQLEELG